jgi:hypothetical protein
MTYGVGGMHSPLALTCSRPSTSPPDTGKGGERVRCTSEVLRGVLMFAHHMKGSERHCLGAQHGTSAAAITAI